MPKALAVLWAVIKNKDWKKSDELRDLIFGKGFLIDDTKDGTKIRKR